MVEKLKVVLAKIARLCKEKGAEYYDKGPQDATTVFWELEGILIEVLRNWPEEEKVSTKT